MTWVVGLIAVGLLVALVLLLRAHSTARRDAAEATALADALAGQVRTLEAALDAARTPPPAPVPVSPSSAMQPAPALTDIATGLYNEEFFRVTLDTRVSAARRHLRPIAVVLLQVAAGVKEGAPANTAPPVVAEAVSLTLRDADTACRLDDGRFALILEDTPENGAVWTVERVRRALAGSHPNQTLWAGIACYPAHAFDASELFDRASNALDAAREWHQDRIEVATAE
jgi:two-component system cell cycle response regulator